MIPERIMNERKFYLQQVMQWCREVLPGNCKVIVPFSGGLDSSVVAGVLVRALGPKNIIAINIGHDTSSSIERGNARIIAQKLGFSMLELQLDDIHSLYTQKVTTALTSLGINQHSGLGVTRDASLVYQFIQDIARSIGGNIRIVGTLDLTEKMIGYYPKGSFYGDFSPIGGLTRGEVRQLARELGLPELPEAHAVVPGCGNIAAYYSEQSKNPLSSERALDDQVLALFGESERELNENFVRLCARMQHKSRGAVLTIPTFFPSETRRTRSHILLNGN